MPGDAEKKIQSVPDPRFLQLRRSDENLADSQLSQEISALQPTTDWNREGPDTTCNMG